jgi:hypothetical protein
MIYWHWLNIKKQKGRVFSMSNQTMQAGFLRQLAKSAKERLKNQNYQGQNTLIKKMNQGGGNNYNMVHFQPNYTMNRAQITIKLIDERCQTEFCNKVREFLKEADTTKIVNPISALADKNYMESLNALERQRYIFDIAEKYNRIKEEFYNEQMMFHA